jgi:Ca2+/Na+ antiporter
MILLLFTLLTFPFAFSDNDANRHIRRFITNDAKNNLKYTFHRQAFTYRAMVLAMAGLLPILFYVLEYEAYQSGFLLVFLSYCLYAFLVFLYDFNFRLNRLRKVFQPDYVQDVYYVSREKNAAWYDRMLVKYSAEKGLTPEELNKKLNDIVLIVLLFSGILLTLACSLIK